MSETVPNTSFYNMLAHIVHQNKLVEENVAVKNVWKKNDIVFFDLYFYRKKKSQVIDSVYVHDLLDLTTEKYYRDAKAFLEDYSLLKNKKENRQPEEHNADFRHLEEIRDDLIILTFMAKCNLNFTNVKTKAIHDFINAHKPKACVLSNQYITSYLKSLKPNEEDFYKALDNLKSKTPEEAEEIMQEAVKISISDGAIHYQERLYLAEILQTLREHGLEPNVEF